MPRKNNSGETAGKSPFTPRRSAAGSPRTGLPAASTAASSAVNPSRRNYTEAQVRERAYYIYLERRDSAGDSIGDWLQAERELRGGPPSARS